MTAPADHGGPSSRISINGIAQGITAVEALPRQNVAAPQTDEEFEGLKNDIAKRGVQVPVEMDADTGEILDGYHRLKACAELGLPSPQIVERHLESEQERREHAIALNLLRRHLDPVGKGEMLVQLLDSRGVMRGQGARNDRHSTSATVAEVAEEIGVRPRTAESWLEAAALPAEQKEKIAAGETTVRRAKADVRREHFRANPPPPPPRIPTGTFDVILADPAWRYDRATEGRAVEDHYPTMDLEEIKALGAEGGPLRRCMATNAMVFLWATSLLPQAFEVLEAWGLEYITSAAWDKGSIGQGYYWRQQHETLLLAKRGDGLGAPASDARPPSVIRAPRGRHSEKPAQAYEQIERMYPHAKRLELFARAPREGWESWGNELSGTKGPDLLERSGS